MIRLFLALASVLHAAPIISGIVADDITAYGARIRWQTNVTTSADHILWGTVSQPSCSGYANDSILLQNFGYTDHGWFLSGLSPSTTYYYRVASTNSGETCSAEQSLTTLGAESGVVTFPTAPTAVADMTPPTSFTTTYTVASDCSDLQSNLNTAAAQDGNNNYRIIIPASTICTGQFSLPNKSGSNPSGTGKLVLTTDATLPPNGSRLESSMTTSLPRLISRLKAVEYYQTSAPGSCSEVGVAWVDSDSTDPNAFLHFCVNTTGPVWTAVAMSSGTAAPGTCVAETYFYDTDEADPHSKVHYCFETNKYINWNLAVENNITPFAALYAAASAHDWIVTGIWIQQPKLPTSYTSILPTGSGTGNGDQYFSNSKCLAYTDATNSRISFNRVYFDAVGYPHRIRDTFCFFEGTDVEIVNSYFNETNFWRPEGSLETTPNTIFMAATGGPFRIENNYFKNGHGITIFHSDDPPVGRMMSNGTIRRNTFFEDPADNALGVASNGRKFFRRHMLECKRCLRWLVEGNVFSGGWPALNQGATIALTPRAGQPAETAYVGDFDFRYNQILWSPQPFLLTGHNDYSAYQNKATNRVRIAHNVIYGNGRASDGSTDGWPLGSDFNGQMLDMGLGLQNLAIQNNAVISMGSTCCDANLMSFAGDWCGSANSRLLLENNIYTSLVASNTGWWGIRACGAFFSGTAALNPLFALSWTATGNAWQAMLNGVFSDGNAYPSNNYRSETVSNFTGALYTYGVTSDVGTIRPKATGIFAAGSSTARANNGGDNGPDYVAFDSAQGNARNLRVLSITSSAANVHYTAPDTAACTVEYGTSATALTGSRITDTPAGSRFRTVGLSGLNSATNYHVRVYCARMISTSFATL